MSQSATTGLAASGAAKSAIETSTIRAISWRLIPFLGLAYFLAYLDRVNLGFAALTMNAELKFSPTIFSWGAGIFFIGYFLFEVPSNLALERFGASRWIARIMVTWGIISALMAMVSGVWSFYGLRFLLGLAEAGFFPGIILYLTYWYPAEYRARFLAAFAVAGRTKSLAIVKARKRDRGQTGSSTLHAWPGAGFAQGAAAEPDLFRICQRSLRHGVLAAADREGVRLLHCANRIRHRGTVSVRHHRDDFVGPAFGRQPRTRRPCRPAAAADGACARHLRLHG